MGSGPVLVIVDMQYYFLQRGLDRRPGMQEEWDALVEKIQQQIKIAKSKRYPIVVLEYSEDLDGSEPLGIRRHKNRLRYTDSKLTKAIGRYKLHKFKVKNTDNGADSVVDALKAMSWASTNILVTGVNRNYCIQKTVYGLFNVCDTVITIIDDAVGSERGSRRFNRSLPSRVFLIKSDETQPVLLFFAK